MSLQPLTLAAITTLLPLLAVAFGPERGEAVSARKTAPHVRLTRDGAPRPGSQRRVDRVITRRVRDGIRADPFLVLATPLVKVTSNRGVVRLVGQVRTDKERSSIAFKAGQTAGVKRIDDRVTIGNGVEGAAW